MENEVKTVIHRHYHYHTQKHWASPIFEHFKLGLKFQLWFHRTMCSLWGLSMLVVPFFPPLYGHNLGILIVLEVSLYANFATEAGAIPATNAAISSKNVETNQPQNVTIETQRPPEGKVKLRIK